MFVQLNFFLKSNFVLSHSLERYTWTGLYKKGKALPLQASNSLEVG
jgi:hypothetical protein